MNPTLLDESLASHPLSQNTRGLLSSQVLWLFIITASMGFLADRLLTETFNANFSQVLCMPLIQRFSNMENSKLGTDVKLSNPWGWSSTASAIRRLSEELGVESLCNFCCNSHLCCSVMWVITTNQSWRLPHFPLHFPPGKANYNGKAAKAAL